jgi:integrase
MLRPNDVMKLPEGMHCDGDYLWLRVKGGSRSWIVRGPRKAGKKQQIGLGSAAKVSLALARKNRDALLEQWKNGVDPVEERHKAKEAAAKRKTFAEVAEAFIANNQSGWSTSALLGRSSTLDQWRHDIDVVCRPIANKDINTIVVGDVEAIVSEFWDAGHHPRAHGVRGRIEAVFDFAFAKGWTTRDNPASARVFKHLVKGKRAPKKAHASLAWEKVPAFVERLRASDAVAARIVEFSILTGVRSQEARGAQWSEIDFDRKVWTVPPERMKRRLPHEVPLSGAALALIERMQVERTFRHGNNDGFIFPGGRGEAQSDDKAIRHQATWALVKRIEPAAATPHGFRSSFAIWGEHQGIEPHLIERCLAHDERKATQRAYRGIERDQLTEKRRPIMEAWGAFVDGAHDNVVPFERRAA